MLALLALAVILLITLTVASILLAKHEVVRDIDRFYLARMRELGLAIAGQVASTCPYMRELYTYMRRRHEWAMMVLHGSKYYKPLQARRRGERA